MNAFIPKMRYRARVIGTKLGEASSGNPMTTLKCEIIDDKVEHDGKEYEVAGRQFPLFLMHVQNESWGQAKVEEFCRRLDIDIQEEDDGMGGTALLYDDSLHNEYFKGMEFDIILHAEENVKREEKRPGEKLGRPILDGEGKEIKDGWRVVGDIGDVPQYCNPSRNETIAAQPV